MTLKADIKYKTNWQQGALKGDLCLVTESGSRWTYHSIAQRRNKWVCALKISLAKVKMFGPTGDPDSKPPPKPITMVPWEHVQEQEQMKEHGQLHHHNGSQMSLSAAYAFVDQNAVMRA
jgi:hypothetical protein